MPLFCFMFIQGEQLLSASGYKRDIDTVERLLEKDRNLVHYKNSVSRTEWHSTYACMYVCMYIYMYVCMYYICTVGMYV